LFGSAAGFTLESIAEAANLAGTVLEETDKQIRYRIGKGDHYAKIASALEECTGGTNYKDIQAANPRFNPRSLRPGTEIIIPKKVNGEVAQVEQKKADLGPETIIVDAGHGMFYSFKRKGWLYDCGTAFDTGNGRIIRESDIVWNVANLVFNQLQGQGYNVVMSRTNNNDDERSMKGKSPYDLNENFSISNRVRTSKDHNTVCFVSIHCSGSTSENATGCETLYYTHTTARSDRLAQTIQDQVITSLARYNVVNRGIKPRNNLGVLKRSRGAAALAEPGFLSNDHDRAYLTSPEGQKAIANAIVRGTIKYLYERSNPTQIATKITH